MDRDTFKRKSNFDVKKVFQRIICCLVVFSAANAMSQQDAEPPSARIDLPEEIIVNVAPPLTSIKREINLAQKVMFTLFNDLNDDDRFDIHCEYIKRRQSKIREQVCRANFFKTAQREEAELTLKELGYAGMQPSGPGTLAVEMNQAILQEKMAEIFIQYPEFMKAVNNVIELSEKYENQLEQNFF